MEKAIRRCILEEDEFYFNTGQEQAGFTRGKSTIINIHIVLEKINEARNNLLKYSRNFLRS
jgi:hypothetical protein